MKLKHLFLRIFVALLACATPLGWFGLLAFFLNPGTVSPVLGAYPRLNTELKIDATTDTSLVQEQLWAKSAVMHSMQNLHQTNPFSDGLSGTPMSGKALVNVPELAQVSGTIVNIPTVALANSGGVIGGKGTTTVGDRVGNADKMKVGNFQVQVGVYWVGAGLAATARDETVIGGYWDKLSKDSLQNKIAKKMSDDCMMKILEKSGALTATAPLRNYILPDGVTSRATIRSANVVSGSLIVKSAHALARLGGRPISLAPKDSGGTNGKNYLYLATDNALMALDNDTSYQNAFQYGADRGDGNPLFTGEVKAWRGQAIYRWYQFDHPNYEAVGSPLEPRGLLGVAITAGDTGTIIQGGGSAAAAAYVTAGGLVPQYFQFFSNSPYSYWNGETIAAVTNVTRYLTILNSDGTFGVYSYQVNNGNQITILAKVVITSGSTIAAQSYDHSIGALIYECNVLGTPLSRQIDLGEEALFAGAGQIDGSVIGPLNARRTFYAAPHDTEFEIGLEAKWGVQAFVRADGIYPNFIVSEAALPISGAPVIS